MRPFSAVAAAMMLVAPLPAQAEATAAQTPITKTAEEIAWVDCPPPAPAGAQCAFLAGDRTQPGLFSYRIKMPDNYRMFVHVHPTAEQVVVLKGEYHAGFGDKIDPGAARTLPAGSFMMIPAGLPHYAWTKGETIVQVYAQGPWAMKK